MFADSDQSNGFGPQSIVGDIRIPPKVSLAFDDLIASGQRPLRFNSGLIPYSAAPQGFFGDLLSGSAPRPLTSKQDGTDINHGQYVGGVASITGPAGNQIRTSNAWLKDTSSLRGPDAEPKKRWEPRGTLDGTVVAYRASHLSS